MELYNTVTGCGETVSYFNTYGVLAYVSLLSIVAALSFIFIIYAVTTIAERYFSKESRINKLLYKLDSSFTLFVASVIIVFAALIFILQMIFPGAPAYSKSEAEKILSDRLKSKTECLDAAVYYGVEVDEIAPDVLRNYTGENEVVLGEMFKRYSHGVGGFEHDYTKAGIYKLQKENAVKRYEPISIPPIPLDTRH